MRPILAAALPLLTAAAALAQQPVEQGPRNTDFPPAFPEQTRAPAQPSGVEIATETVADGLDQPWAVAELPNGELLVTEKPGALRLVAGDGSVSAPIAGVPAVDSRRQGGLLDVAVSPDFAETREVYLTFSEPRGGGRTTTALARGRLSADGARLEDVAVLWRQEPAWPNAMHYGSRIAFDGAGHVFVTTGERFTVETRVMAQDRDNHFGKIVRLTRDGGIPADNPFADEGGPAAAIWSTGHRNVQAAAWDAETDRLLAVEHGPRGGDELNVVEAGANYGWPVISYGENYSGSPVQGGAAAQEGLRQPVYFWDPVIAPSGMTVYRGAMFPEWRGDVLVGGLVAQALVRLDLQGDRVRGEERLLDGVGRVRDVAETADGALLIVLDETDAPVLRLTLAD